MGCADDLPTIDAALRDVPADIAPLDVARSDVPVVDVHIVDVPVLDGPLADVPAHDTPPPRDVAPTPDVPIDAPDSPAVDVPIDVPIDALRPDPLAALGACLGTSAPLTISRQMPFVSVPVGALRGEFVLDHGTTFSSIDLAAFPSPGPATSGCDPARLGGGVAFAVGTVQAMLRYDPARVRVTADGRDLGAHAISFLVVGNGRYAGGGMHFCPDALLDDGALDLVVMPHLGLGHALANAHHLYRGTHGRVPGALIAKVAEVTVEVIANTAWLDLDGEAPGRAPVTFRVRPGRLRLAGAPT